MVMHICGAAAILHQDPLPFGQGASFKHICKHVFLSISPYLLVERLARIMIASSFLLTPWLRCYLLRCYAMLSII